MPAMQRRAIFARRLESVRRRRDMIRASFALHSLFAYAGERDGHAAIGIHELDDDMVRAHRRVARRTLATLYDVERDLHAATLAHAAASVSVEYEHAIAYQRMIAVQDADRAGMDDSELPPF